VASPILPPPPSADQIDFRWLTSETGKAVIAAYLAEAYAQQNFQVVVIKNGQRQPPVSPAGVGASQVIQIVV